MILLTLATSCICFWFPLALPYIRHLLDLEAYAVKCMVLIARVWADSRVDFALVIFLLLLFMHILPILVTSLSSTMFLVFVLIQFKNNANLKIVDV